MRAHILMAFVPLVLLPAVAFAAGPEGWRLAGNDPSSYLMDRDSIVTYAGKPSGRLMSVCASDASDSTMRCRGFGTMMQSIKATEYAKKRIRFSGYVKARDVREWAGLWMRVDGEGEPPQTLAFDNMKDRPITGTRDWTHYEVVLDVRRDATKIFFGILLHGQGTVWLSGANLETVSTAVPTTGREEQ
jgi:hypothetical protein